MNTSPAWYDPALGNMPGLGNDRPGGGAEIKSELEPGLAVVRYLNDNSRVDGEWSVIDDRGYTWWAHRLAQRVWSEPALDDEGIDVYRVFARTQVLREVADAEAATGLLDPLNGLSAGSALVTDAMSGSVDLVASMWVHRQNVEWVARTFSVFAAIQVAQAHQQADMMATLVGGEPATSTHPESGPRPTPDDMLGLIDLVARMGVAPSAWVGDELAMAPVLLQRSPIVTLATGDETGLTFEVPYRETTALVQFATDEAHPSLGNGLLVRCSLPGGPGPGPTWSSLRNRQELESLTRAHFLGCWVGSGSFATHVCFYPNMVARTGMSVMNAAFSMINRIRWLANLGRTDA